jgi:hypothetical protein
MSVSELLNVFDCLFQNYPAISELAFLMGLSHDIGPHKKTSGGSFSVIAETAPGLFKS